jgi:hypothetical protein
MTKYTVIGFYPETRQRFAESFPAPSADAAEKKAVRAAARRGIDLAVVGVIQGDHKTSDTAQFVEV